MKIISKIQVPKQLFLMVFFVIFSNFSLFSQSISMPTLAGFSTICADDSYNLIPFSFSSAGVFNTGNTFTLELSDSTGSFSIITSQATSNSSPISIPIPSTIVGGTNYKFRVKSSNPVVFSPITATFEIDYLSVKDIKINNNLPNLVICGASGNLSITDPTILPSNLKYIWYKNSTPILGETNSSLTVTSPGNYYVEIDYGSCSKAPNPSVKSLAVLVSANTNNDSYTIGSSNGDSVLPTVTSTTLTCNPIIAGNTYEWYKDLNLLTETSSSYTTDEPGEYKLVIKDQFCTYETTKKLKLLILGGVIPNMVSPNGDSENDFWKIPGEYIGTNTNVTIIDSNGKTVIKTDNYNNDWPQDAIDFGSINPVYYYIITPLDGIVKKGTITIVK